MKKKNYFLIFLLVLSCVLCSFAIACQKDDNANIGDVAKTGESGKQYTVEGVVYGVVSDGYYIADSSAGIFVSDSTSVKVGDKLKVNATLNVKSNVPSLTEATIKKTAESQTALSPVSSSLKELNAMTAGRANYYKYLSVSGTLVQTSETEYKLTEGSDALILDSRSNSQYFSEYVGNKVDLSVITTGYSTGWVGVFVGGASDIALHDTDLDGVKEEIFASVAEALPTDAYLAINLPKSYATEPNVTYEWSVVTGSEVVSITDNVATVTEPSSTTKVTLKLTLKSGEQSVSQNFDINVKAATATTIADVDSTAMGVVVKLEGTVVAKGFNQVETRITLLISDNNGNNVGLDLDRASYNSYKLGDTVRAVGTYTKATDSESAYLTAIENVLVSSNPSWSVDYTKLNATTLETDADYAALLANPGANSNKLYKIVAPWLIYSGNTTYNFVRFGANAVNAQSGYTNEGTSWYYCFPRNTLSETVNGLEESLNIPFLQSGAREYKAYTIYAYAVWQGGTTWQFVIPEMSAVISDLGVLAEDEIQNAIGDTTINALTAGTLNLPFSTQSAGEINWTSSNEAAINPETGAYAAVTEYISVILTAHYTINGTQTTYEVEIELLAGEPEYVTVTEALEKGDGVIPFLKGVIVGFGPNTGTGIPGGAQMGVFISDGVNLLYIPEGQFDRSDDEANYDKVYTIGEGEDVHRLAIGDELYFNKATLNGSSLSLGTKVVLNAEDVELSWNPVEQLVTELNSFADMQEYFGNSDNTFKLFKFTATAENPLYLGGSSSTYDSLNLKFYFGDVEGGVSSNNVKVNTSLGAVTVAAKARSSEQSLGLLWWKELNPDMPNAFATTTTAYGFTGTVYAVWTATTSTYCQLALLSEGFTLKALTEEELAVNEIKAVVNTEVSAAEAGTITLPASTAHALQISWTSDNAVLNAETGEYSAVTAETVVTLTASYTVGGQEKTLDIEIKLLAEQIEELTVTQLLTAETLPEKYVLVATVASMGVTSNNTAEQRAGLILTDGVNTIYYTEAIYTFNGEDIKAGDVVKISGAVLNKEGGNQILGGGTLEVVSSDNEIDLTNINLYATVSSDEELAALAASMDSPLGGVVVKFTGTFSFVGTGASNCRYQLNYKDAASSAAARYTFGDNADRTLSFSVAGNGYTFENWWEDCGMPEGKASTCYPVTGTIIAVACGYGATMTAWSIISIDCTAAETAA